VLLFWLVICGGVAYVFWWPKRSATTLVYIVELSDQMLTPFEDEEKSKWEVVKSQLANDLGFVPQDVNVGLRVFGLGQRCAESELLVEPFPGQVNEIRKQLAELEPSGSKAPLAEAIFQAYDNDLQLAPDKHNTLIVLTTGMDTCDPDGLVQVTRKIEQLNLKADAYIVGLSVKDPIVHTTLQELAAANDGVYLPVDTTTQLEDTLNRINENLKDGNAPTAIAPTLTPTPTPTSTPIPLLTTTTGIFTVPVPAAVEWLDTGIWVTAGQSLGFSTFGSINLWGGTPEATVGDPDGRIDGLCPSVANQSDCLINDTPYGKLVGKIGDNEPFEVGDHLETSAPTDGILYLAANDNASYFNDNSGVYEVTIALSVPLPPTPVAVRGTTFSVIVPAEAAWVDTGIEAQAGQNLIFSASGSTNTWGGIPEATTRDPNGLRDALCPSPENKPDCLMNQVLYGKLIGKIGDSEPFEVGANLEMLAPAEGMLYLAVNDNAPYFYDNSGAYEVTITDPTLYDNFNDPEFDGTFNKERWSSTSNGPSQQVEQHDGKMVFTLLDPQPDTVFGLSPTQPGVWTLDQPRAIEAKLSLSGETETTSDGAGNIALGGGTPLENNRHLTIQCIVAREGSVHVKCFAHISDKTNQTDEEYREFGSKLTNFDTEHMVRIEIDPEVNVMFYIDGTSVGSYRPIKADEVKDDFFYPGIWMWSATQDSIKGYADDVRFGPVGPQKRIITTKSDALPR
jgi:hypothetical protein